MTHTQKIVQVVSKTPDETLSAGQKQFNSLSKKIDQQKKILLAWKEAIPVYHQKSRSEYNPLVETLCQHQFAWAQHLDGFYEHPLFKKADKAKIKHLIIEVCEQLIADESTEDVKALFNKYSDEDYDALVDDTQSMVGEMMRNLAKNMFNIDLDDDIDISSPEKFKAHLEEKIRTQEQVPVHPIKESKKTKAQRTKEARQQQEEEAMASKSVQEVYRKLVAVLHPDREPDAQERLRKTELMQRVNSAYGKKDLLQLLELQLEIEQIDVVQLSQMADSRLKYFNKILKQQIVELTEEISQIEAVFKAQLNIPFYKKLTSTQLLLKVANDIRAVQSDIVEIKRNLSVFDQPDVFKIWLKSYKIPKDTYNPLFLDDFPFRF